MTEDGEDVAWPDLREGEIVPSDDGELLFRQVSPSFFVDGDKVSSQVFRPTRKDAGMLSTSRASVQTAEASHRFHTDVLGLRSAGVLAVTVAETTGAGARVVDDSKAPGGPPPCPPGHAYVDFRPFGGARTKRISATLLDAAMTRGWQYRPAPAGHA